MRSPFAIFRKHQATMMVATVMLAMFGFIVAPAIRDPGDMPPILKVIFIAGTLGCIAWIIGISRKKSAEFGLVGVIIGTVIGVGASLTGGPPVMVKADNGDINAQEFNFLQYQRSRANEFIARAVQIAREKPDSQFLQPPAQFGFHADPERDIVIGELLRREAQDLGIVVTDEMVNDYMRAITQNKLGGPDVKTICGAMALSESDLYNILRSQIMARLGYQYLYDWSTLSSASAAGATLPPESYWDFYQRLNVRQSVGIAPIPIRAFIDQSAEPSDNELEQLFNAHRDDFPNRADDGKFEEGRPGFRQPRKTRLAYLEAAYDAIEKLVESPTDEDIEAYYNEHYKSVPADELGGDSPSHDAAAGPALPAPEDEKTEGKTDGADLPPAEGEEKPAPGESQEGAFLPPPAKTQFVALLDDEPASDAPAESTATDADNSPKAETAGNETAADGTADTATPADQPGESAAADVPPPPPVAEPNDGEPVAPGSAGEPAVRELDDELRGEIRDQLLRERTDDKLKQIIDDAVTFMRELELRLTNLPEDKEYLTQEQALEKLREYAEKNNLTEAETPPLSALELQDSEEYPIGRAVDQLFSDPFNPRPVTSVVEQVFTSAPREVFRSRSVVQPETDSRFVYWKTDDQPEYVPQSLSDPGIREQVVAVWRELEAREKAQARAEELAKLAQASEKPLGEVLAGQTVTGAAEAPAISVLHPPRFSWMSKADPRMSPNPWSTPPPELTRLRNVPGHIGESFMQTVFDDLKEGDVGVAHSMDKNYFYVVRVDERTYGRGADRAAFQQQFMREPVFAPYYASDYPKLAHSELVSYQTDWSDALFKKYHVEIIKKEPERSADEEEEPSSDQAPSRPPTSYY